MMAMVSSPLVTAHSEVAPVPCGHHSDLAYCYSAIRAYVHLGDVAVFLISSVKSSTTKM